MSIIERPDVQPAVPTLPAWVYCDPALFERERREIFARGDQLPNPGDFLAGTIIGYPIILIHQKDGSLRGLNIRR